MAPKGRKARALLAILAMSFSGSVSRGMARGLLWSLRAREQADASLRQATGELHESLRRLAAKPLLQASSGKIALPLQSVSVDALRLGDVATGDADPGLMRGSFLDVRAGRGAR